jgi:hypothetical protein
MEISTRSTGERYLPHFQLEIFRPGMIPMNADATPDTSTPFTVSLIAG